MESHDISRFKEAVQLFAAVQALVTVKDGMITENKKRELSGESIAYCEEAFFQISASIESAITQYSYY
jgi:hypothetical protein